MIKQVLRAQGSGFRKQRKLYGILFALVLIWGLGTGNWALAAFEDTGTGARPTALGGTYVAVGDDVQSLMYNPAGLAALRQKDFSTEYSRLFAGLTDGSNLSQYFLGYGQPLKYGTVAVGWKQFGVDNLYSERTLSLGYGDWITSKLAAGAAVKQLHQSFGTPNIIVDDNGNIVNGSPSFFTQNGDSRSAYSFDLGLMYRLTDRYTLGTSLQNVNEPNIALNPNDHDIVHSTFRSGLAYHGDHGLLLAGSYTSGQIVAHERDYTFTGAAEKWWDLRSIGAFAARSSLAAGSRDFRQMTMGAGYRFRQYQVDYALVFQLSGVTLGETAGTHRFSFSYLFGPIDETQAPVIKADNNSGFRELKPEAENMDQELLRLLEENDKPVQKADLPSGTH